MNYTIRLFIIAQLTTIVFLFYPQTVSSQDQPARKQDFSLWTWVQVEKKLHNKQYIEFQYQVRFDQNATQFNRSNIYFIYGKNFGRHVNAEVLYQLNENYIKDQHTFYLGLTYKTVLFRHASVAFRTAVQNTRNHFTGDYGADKPRTEWRNRIRFTYKLSKPLSISASAEPYLLFKPMEEPYLSRIRYVAQVAYKYNKYQKFTLFYLIQPTLITDSRPKTNFVLGLAYHITLPNKAKGYQKFFRFNGKKEDGDSNEPTEDLQRDDIH